MKNKHKLRFFFFFFMEPETEFKFGTFLQECVVHRDFQADMRYGQVFTFGFF